MGYGVIGSPTGSGPVSLGSSPGTPAVPNRQVSGLPVFHCRSSKSAKSKPGVTRQAASDHGPAAGVADCQAHGLGRSAPAAGAPVAAAPVTPLMTGQPVQDQQDDGPDDRANDAGQPDRVR